MKKIFNYKKILLVVLLLLIITTTIISFISIIINRDEKEIKNVLTTYFNYLINGDFDKSNEYLSEKFDYTNNNYFNDENMKLYLSKYTYKILEIEIKKDVAIAKLELTHPNKNEITKKYISYLGKNILNFDSIGEQEYKKKLLTDDELLYSTDTIQLELRKTRKNWEIVVSTNFEFMINEGRTMDLSIDKLTENEKKVNEIQEYINNNLELTNYLVKYSTNYSDEKVPSVTNVEIKNNGNKNISYLELQIDFLDDSSNIILTRNVDIITLLSAGIKPGYVWKMENEEFIEIPNIEKNIDINKCNVKISNILCSDVKEQSLTNEQKYINEYMEILSATVKKQTRYDGYVLPGLSNLSIKNNGEKNLSEVKVTVFFQDINGKDIAECSCYPVGGLFGATTLKANYSWKMNSDEFYELENLASEVDLSRHRVEITDITFEE